jgi:hypothetical protein
VAGDLSWRTACSALTTETGVRERDQALDFEIDVAAHLLSAKLAGHRGYQAIQTIPGIGPTLAAVFVPLVSELW